MLVLIDLTSTALENYYKIRLIEFAGSRTSSIGLMIYKMMKKVTYLRKEVIMPENDYIITYVIQPMRALTLS